MKIQVENITSHEVVSVRRHKIICDFWTDGGGVEIQQSFILSDNEYYQAMENGYVNKGYVTFYISNITKDELYHVDEHRITCDWLSDGQNDKQTIHLLTQQQYDSVLVKGYFEN